MHGKLTTIESTYFSTSKLSAFKNNSSSMTKTKVLCNRHSFLQMLFDIFVFLASSCASLKVHYLQPDKNQNFIPSAHNVYLGDYFSAI